MCPSKIHFKLENKNHLYQPPKNNNHKPYIVIFSISLTTATNCHNQTSDTRQQLYLYLRFHFLFIIPAFIALTIQSRVYTSNTKKVHQDGFVRQVQCAKFELVLLVLFIKLQEDMMCFGFGQQRQYFGTSSTEDCRAGKQVYDILIVSLMSFWEVDMNI